MAYLIAVTGLSGAGKTTAIDYLQKIGVGARIYLGQAILDAVIARGLPIGPENEKEVRLDLRRRHGPAFLAILASPQIHQHLNQYTNVLIDAIFNEEEYSFMQGICSKTASFRLIAIEADFATRSQRLIRRQDRPCTARQLETRDAFELNQLGIGKVIDLANFKVINESGLDEFELQLRALWSAICANNT
jgi:dephospho-CoA kinase